MRKRSYSQSQDVLMSTQGSRASKRGKTKFAKKVSIPRNPTTVSVGRQSFPKQLRNTLVYAEQIGITTDVSGWGKYIMCCNGLYDPNNTGTGHQPLYFDQLMLIYNHYTVISSSIEIQCAASTGSPTTPWTTAMYIDDDTTTVTTIDSALERPGCVFGTTSVTNGDNPKFTLGWSALKNFGPNPQMDNQLQGDNASNPTEQMHYVIIAFGGTPLASVTVNYNVRIKYNVLWDEIKTIAQS